MKFRVKVVPAVCYTKIIDANSAGQAMRIAEREIKKGHDGMLENGWVDHVDKKKDFVIQKITEYMFIHCK